MIRFRRKQTDPVPLTVSPAVTPEPEVNPTRRLKNLEKAHLRVSLKLANPRLAPNHRSELERKLGSISAEIACLRVELEMA